jgi:hypothetical protein
MRFTFNCYVLFIVFSFLTACKDKPSTQKNTPSVSEASVDKKYNNYRHFRGTIGNVSIKMDLIETKTAHDLAESPRFSGYYSDDSNQQPIAFSGKMDSTGEVELEEARGHVGTFRGKFNADSTFTGIWINIEEKRNYPILLRETTNDGAIAMDVFPFEDSLKLFENKADSPQAEFSMDALLPAKNTEGSVFEFLRTQIFKALTGDSLAQDYSYLQLRDIQKTARDSFFKSYKTELQNEIYDSIPSAMMNHAQSTSMEVVSNTDGLLSLGFTYYGYSGGAHGSHGTKLITYDVKNKKRMTLNDVFKPNYQKTLNAAVMRVARRYFGVKPNESLESSALVSTVEANDNYAISRKGILFNYEPYEIASYAQGEIQLFVPFEEVKGILK